MYESKMKSEAAEHLFRAVLSLKTVEECYRFFDDLCTYSEIQAMVQRYQIAEELEKGTTFARISQELGVSTATVTRVNRCMQYGAGGYQTALSRREPTEEPPADTIQ